MIFTTEPLWAAIFAVWLINEPFSSVDAVGPEPWGPWGPWGMDGGWMGMGSLEAWKGDAGLRNGMGWENDGTCVGFFGPLVPHCSAMGM